jgi:receptor protein-tyrosine kinase
VNAPTPKGNFIDADMTTAQAILMERHQLSRDAAWRIRELMQRNGLSFTEAAMQLGLIQSDGTTEQAALEAVSQDANDSKEEGAGLVEAAIRRAASGRQLVLRQGEEVTPGEHLKAALDPNNARNEKMRVLRTELLLLNESQRGANVVALISPDSGEGRSQLAAELAISFAQLGRRTLLIDADMRRPKQHVLFGSQNQFGLSLAISQNSRPYLHPVHGLPGMYLCTAGAIPPNPLELLSDGRFGKLLTDWRATYEFVVIDTPPIGQFADALAVATVAGRVLVVSRPQHSLYKSTRDMMRRLGTTQAKVLGAVMNTF